MRKFIVATLFFCYSNFCFPSDKTNHLVYVLIDKSDSCGHVQFLSSEHIISTIVKDKKASVEAYVSLINDVSLNAVSRFCLDEGKWYENPLTRQDVTVSFYSAMDMKLKEIHELKSGTERSGIYLWICRVLNDVSAIPAQNKTVVIFSDMMENSDLTTSFYALYDERVDFLEYYDEIASVLDASESLNDLSGIDIIVVYQPDLSSDGLFFETRKFWTKFMASKGADIKFVANLQ